MDLRKFDPFSFPSPHLLCERSWSVMYSFVSESSVVHIFELIDYTCSGCLGTLYYYHFKSAGINLVPFGRQSIGILRGEPTGSTQGQGRVSGRNLKVTDKHLPSTLRD
jgi:hypothetical protein